MNPASGESATVKEFVQRALRGDRSCQPIGDHLAFAIEIHAIGAWWNDSTVNRGLRQWILLTLLEGEARARKDMGAKLLGTEMADMCNPLVPWQKIHHHFEYGTNRCSVCAQVRL